MCPSVHRMWLQFRDAITTQMYVALNLCFLCNLGLPSQGSSFRRKTCHAPNTATPQHDSSICRLPPNKATGIVYLKAALLYRIELTLITVPPFALRIELHGNSIRTNRAIMLGSSYTGRMTCFSPNRATLSWWS